jgi:small subunit ribosomal protein S8
MIQNPLANCITLIRNGILNQKHSVLIQKSVILYDFLFFLTKQRFILSYTDYNQKYIKVYLRYNQYGKLVMHDIKLLSTKSRRLYIHYNLLKHLKTSVCIFILSTTKGYLTHRDALSQKIGGEIICYIL